VHLVPDPLLRRKFGSAGNRNQDLWVCSQEVSPDHTENDESEIYSNVVFILALLTF
jgi:hypothetical protein